MFRWLRVYLFFILFRLSMDYPSFRLSRISELFDQTGDNTNSVPFGIRFTGRLITGAALIIVAVFWRFAAGDLVGLQQMSFELGIAILMDVIIVRVVLAARVHAAAGQVELACTPLAPMDARLPRKTRA